MAVVDPGYPTTSETLGFEKNPFGVSTIGYIAAESGTPDYIGIG